ncbi:hypothetical protein CP533_4370 [Ophiocordyceps camponoti-saundersi (nom. inval.)]|nr:hypothetical protein CP533_4370 [Ophiocordyceps camponoti-saundersi (nom. inval.)]
MVKRKRSVQTLRSTQSPMGHDVELRLALNSRTLKRVRNGRPSEDEVHQRTLAILYSAQQREQQPSQQGEMQSATTPTPTADHDHQRTLHRYWNIASSPSSCASSSSSSPQPDRSVTMMLDVDLSCDDCGAGLTDEAGEPSMQMACVACGKHVCLGCSVSRLGEDRHCLHCVGAVGSNDTSAMVF